MKPVRYAPYADMRQSRKPGLAPLDPDAWMEVGPDFAAQMAYRDRLIAERRDVVFAETPAAAAAQAELLETLLAHLAGQTGFRRDGDAMTRPDGARIALNGAPAVLIAGRLVQEDLCILEKPSGAEEYSLTAAILCFPSRWSLREKIARPLTAIHGPVPDYGADLAKRVNRVFEGIRPEQPMWRANWTVHDSDEPHQPSGDWRQPDARGGALFIRVERQTLRRLPVTGAVIFGIRTYIDPLEALTGAQAKALRGALLPLGSAEIAYRGGAALHEAALGRLHALSHTNGIKH